jgi:hypothetical protein
MLKQESRDLSLGYLALAEFHLQSGDLVHSREAALESIGQTKRLFGTQHQDRLMRSICWVRSVSGKETQVLREPTLRRR